MRRLLCVVVVFALWAPSTASAFEIGVFDAEAGRQSVGVPATLPLARSTGASIVRIQISWPAVAKVRPLEPENPLDTAYDWRAVDTAVADARALGLRVLLSVSAAPPWAEGADRPPEAIPGSWKPQPAAVGAFMTAVARRYPGAAGFQVWNEPNLSRYLSPQWTMLRRPIHPLGGRPISRDAPRCVRSGQGGGSKQPPGHRGDRPHGDPQPGGGRTMPVRFWREVMCSSSS